MSTSTQHLDQARLALAESLEARRANKLDTADYYLSVAHTHVAFASVEEQRTANLIAAYNGDLLKNPHPVGTDANNEWWAKTAGDLTEQLGVQR